MRNAFGSAAAFAVVLASSAGLAASSERDSVQAVEKYCVASWRQARIAPQDWEDCTQQVFLKLLERVSRERLTEALDKRESPERRELNRAIWCTTQRWRRARKHCSLGRVDVADTKRQRARNEARQTIQDASYVLTDRQKNIIAQSLDGATVAEISDALAMPACRVSDDKYKAIQKLRRSRPPG